MPTVREETYRLLRALGLTTIFGNPGSTELPFLQDFPADFRYVLALQEASAVAMADGFAQGTGRAALVNLHTAIGVGNALGSITTAWHNRTPLVITAGQQARAMLALEPFLVARAAPELPRPYVKWSVEPARPQDVPAAIARAYHLSLQPPRGPTFVSIPMDDWAAAAEPWQEHVVSTCLAPDPAALGEVARLLAESERPAVVVGGDVDRLRARQAVVALAERLRAPVWSAPNAHRLGFPADHPLYQGYLPAAQQALADRLRGHDLVLVLGAPVFQYFAHVPGPVLHAGTRLVQLTDDPEEAARAPLGLSVVGDLALGLAALLPRVPDFPERAPPSPRPPAPRPPATEPLSAAFAMHTLATVLPRDVALVEESPSTRGPMQQHLRLGRDARLYVAGNGALGFALPAAVGLALAAPARPVVCLIGEGSSLYSIQALWTAAQHHLPVAVVVLNNAQYAILKAFAAFTGVGHGAPGLDLPGLDLVAVAQGFGCAAQRITAPDALAPALRAALAADGPTLLDVAIERQVPALM